MLKLKSQAKNMKTKEFWITLKEVVGGFIRFGVMAGLGIASITSLINIQRLIELQKINDWRAILVMQAPYTIIILVLIIAYMKLGIKTTDAHATKLSAQVKIGGQEFSGQYEKQPPK